jgi:hypothetical protein
MRSRLTLAIAFLILFVPTLPTRAAPFVRGDVNVDSRIDISDGIAVLGVLFLGTEAANCSDALDSNDDGAVDVSDGVFLFDFLFLGGRDVPAPFPTCGPDPSNDALACESYPPCPDVECFTESEFTALVRSNVPTVACVPADAARFEAAGIVVTACPGDGARPDCGGSGELGCPVNLDSIESTLDGAARRTQVRVGGSIDGLPIQIGEGLGSLTCSVNATFSATVVVTFQGRSVPGGVEVTRIEAPTVEDLELDLDAPGSILCRLLENQAALFEGALASQLESASEALIDALEAELTGRVICTD